MAHHTKSVHANVCSPPPGVQALAAEVTANFSKRLAPLGELPCVP